LAVTVQSEEDEKGKGGAINFFSIPKGFKKIPGKYQNAGAKKSAISRLKRYGYQLLGFVE